MEISNLGNGVVKITAKNFSMLAGPTLFQTSADVVALTQPAEDKSKTEAMLIDSPGEYEIKGVMLNGVPAQLHLDKDGQCGTNYIIQADDTVVAVLGNIAPGLSDKQLEAMGNVDVLVLPVGGHGLTLDATAASQIVSQVEPKVVIPVHYDDGVSKYEVPQDKLEVFLKEIGATPQEVTKYKVSTKDLPEETAVVVVKPETKTAAKA